MKYRLLSFIWIISAIAKGQPRDFSGINFTKADSVAHFYHGEDLTHLPLLTYKLTHSLPSQAEQFRALYTWVCTNIENDYLSYLKNKQKRESLQGDSIKLDEWNRLFGREVFRKLLKDRKTVCTGYAYLLRKLSTLAGINCKIINGFARTATANVKKLGIPNHSWNAVQLNQKWYVCDPTWSSGELISLDGKTALFTFNYNDGYFLTRPDFFLKNHFPQNSEWALTHTPPEINVFLNAPLVYGAAFKYRLNPVEPESMHIQSAKKDTVWFSFQSSGKIDARKIYIELCSGSHRRLVQPIVMSHKNGVLKLMHRFTKTGYYDLHLKIADDYIVSYTVSVSKRKN